MHGLALSLSLLIASQDPAPVLDLDGLRRQVEELEALLAEDRLNEAGEAVRLAHRSLELDPQQMNAAVAELLERLGHAAVDATAPGVAHDVFSSLVAYRQRVLPDDDLALADARHGLALAKCWLRDAEGALPHAEKVYAVRSRVLPEDHRDVQLACNTLAVARMRSGDLHGAVPLLEQLLESFRRTYPEDHPDLQGVRGNLAVLQAELGNLSEAEVWEEEIVEVFERILPADHLELARARHNLATTKRQLRHFKGGHALAEKAFAVYSVVLPADHPQLQEARYNFAALKVAVGDFLGAKEMFEEALESYGDVLGQEDPRTLDAREAFAQVKSRLGDPRAAREIYEVVLQARSKTLPADHEAVLRVQSNIAANMFLLGDVVGAHALLEKVCAGYTRTLPVEDVLLHEVRLSLAVIKQDLGDFEGALALEQKVLDVLARTVPEDDVELLRCRRALASTKKSLGDVEGALALEEDVLAVLTRTREDDHLDLQRTRQSLAVTRRLLGDFEGSVALARKSVEVASRSLSDDHPELLSARQTLANVLKDLGELEEAQALEQKVLEIRLRSLPEHHPDVLKIRYNLTITRKLLGDVEGAVASFRQVLVGLSRARPDEHPDTQKARLALFGALIEQDSIAEAVAVGHDLVAGHRRWLDTWLLSPRELGVMAQDVTPALSMLAGMISGWQDSAGMSELAGDVLLLQETVRGMETRTARAMRRSLADDERQAAARLERDLSRVADDLVALVRLEAEAADSGEPRDLSGERFAAVRKKERLQAELLAVIGGAGEMGTARVTLQQLAGRLPEGSAGVSVMEYDGQLLALCLRASRDMQMVPLGSAAEVQELVVRVRTVGAGGTASRAPGRRPAGRRPSEGSGSELRDFVLGPILAALPGIDTLYLSLDEALHLVPLDALSDERGKLVGERVRIRGLVSLFDLLQPLPAASEDAPRRLLAFGGIDYDRDDTSGGHLEKGVAATVQPVRSGGSSRYAALPGTAREVNEIASLFASSFSDGVVVVRGGERADNMALRGGVAGASHVHLSTHGYFAPEWVRTDRVRDSDALGGLEQHRGATGLSPLVLCGLALSGANLEPDELGRHPGIVTGEELLRLDLSECELVTLSACDTSLGVRRAGQGYASLRAALQGAGARHVLTSLWKVSDEQTVDLMTDFYRRLWQEKKDPHTALWEARMAARKRGAAFRDWAGWVMTGV